MGVSPHSSEDWMIQRVQLSIFVVVLVTWIILFFALPVQAQQTLGGITGTVTDTSGGVLADTMVTLVGDQTTLTRTQKTNSSGFYEFVDLPIGTYTLTFTHDGFETQKVPSILVQADRTVTLSPALKVGQVGTTVTVEATPLLNAVDTTNGYVLDKAQLEDDTATHREFHRPRDSFSRRERGITRAAQAPMRGSAISPSGPTDSAIPATLFC